MNVIHNHTRALLVSNHIMGVATFLILQHTDHISNLSGLMYSRASHFA
jgi:hypothetical protein